MARTSKTHLVPVVIICAAFLVVGLPAEVVGQEFRATITGRVTDPGGLIVPGVSVTARNSATNEALTAVTNETGHYTIPYLRPGTYVVTATLAGFNSPEVRQELTIGQTSVLDFRLGLGTVSEQIQVEAPAIDLGKADRGMVVDSARIRELPLNARNPFMLSTLSPGVTYNGGVFQRPFDTGAIGDWSINGGTNRNNEFLMDGAPNNAIQQGTNMVAYVPPVDSVEEFKIMTNTFDAQYGRTQGGVVNVVTKSGTNTLHGTAYEFARRYWLDASPYLDRLRGIPKYVEHDGEKVGQRVDQYGFQLDGPLRIPGLYDGRNRTFFMFNIERYGDNEPSSGTSTYPDERQRLGDFSQLRDVNGRQIVIYDPATGRDVNGTWVRDPFANNIIPPERLNPIAQRVLAYFPLPNTTTPGADPWRENRTDLTFAVNDFYNYVGKIDHNFGPKDRMYARYAYNTRLGHSKPDLFPDPLTDKFSFNVRENHAAVVDYVRTLGSSTTVNLRGSFNRFREGAGPNAEGQRFDATSLGFSTALVGQLPLKIFPQFSFADYSGLGRGQFRNDVSDVYTFQPNLTMSRGPHLLRAGLDMRRTYFLQRFSGFGGMNISTNRAFTQRSFNQADALSGNSIASFLLGAAEGSVDYNPYPTYVWNYVAPWIQDDWKINDRLTLNLGLRWDFNSPPVEQEDRFNYAFDATAVNPVTGLIDQTRFPGYRVTGGIDFTSVDGNPRSPYAFDWNNFQPRIGAAWRLNEKTVIRGGVGRYFLNPLGRGPGSTSRLFAREGFETITPILVSLDGNRTALDSLTNPFPNGVAVPVGSARGLETSLGKSFSFSNPDFEIPYVYQYSVGFQRQLPWRTTLEMSYVGSRTFKGQDSWSGFNEPSLAFRDQCDPTKGGSPAFCTQLLPNPFFGVAGFEGTTRFSSPTLTRYELSRPFPQFGAITEFERNGGRIWYKSVQMTANKRVSMGLAITGTYTWSEMIEQNGFMDPIAQTIERGPYSGDRPHRVTISGVYSLPFGRGRRFLTNLHPVLEGVLGGWGVAASWIGQSGGPWSLPANVVVLKDAKNPTPNTVPNIVQGVIPCVSQMANDGRVTMLGYSVAYGCTEPYFLVLPTFAGRVTPLRDSNIRNPAFYQFDANLAKSLTLRGRARVQLRLEAFNVLNQAIYSTRNYGNNPLNSAFGQINRLATAQSNAPRQVQIGVKFLF